MLAKLVRLYVCFFEERKFEGRASYFGIVMGWDTGGAGDGEREEGEGKGAD